MAAIHKARIQRGREVRSGDFSTVATDIGIARKTERFMHREILHIQCPNKRTRRYMWREENHRRGIGYLNFLDGDF
jgi:hypothetical protein